MTKREAIALVLELAQANALSDAEANENGLQDEQQRQWDAIEIVRTLRDGEV